MIQGALTVIQGALVVIQGALVVIQGALVVIQRTPLSFANLLSGFLHLILPFGSRADSNSPLSFASSGHPEFAISIEVPTTNNESATRSYRCQGWHAHTGRPFREGNGRIGRVLLTTLMLYRLLNLTFLRLMLGELTQSAVISSAGMGWPILTSRTAFLIVFLKRNRAF